MVDEKERSEFYDTLAVTRVQVFPFREGASLGHLRGLASVVLNDQMVIRGLRVMAGENGMFVAYPVDPFYKGEETRNVCSPVTGALRGAIEDAVLGKYREVTGETGEEG